jgi:ATP-dependent DNA ligase
MTRTASRPDVASGCSTASVASMMLVVLDVLAIDGRSVHRRPYWERRQLLEGSSSRVTTGRPRRVTRAARRSGSALSTSGLEGVVTKKRSGHYLPGRRGWIGTKNRD